MNKTINQFSGETKHLIIERSDTFLNLCNWLGQTRNRWIKPSPARYVDSSGQSNVNTSGQDLPEQEGQYIFLQKQNMV